MPKVLLVQTATETVAFAHEMTPTGFELIAAAPGSAAYRDALPEAEYLLGNLESMDDAFYRSASKLRFVQLFSAGYDRVDLDATQRAGVPVANNGGANSRAVAEHTILLMLAV
jgi:phosphoglycerate dehydrogenase-like enzyme